MISATCFFSDWGIDMWCSTPTELKMDHELKRKGFEREISHIVLNDLVFFLLTFMVILLSYCFCFEWFCVHFLVVFCVFAYCGKACALVPSLYLS